MDRLTHGWMGVVRTYGTQFKLYLYTGAGYGKRGESSGSDLDPVCTVESLHGRFVRVAAIRVKYVGSAEIRMDRKRGFVSDCRA